MNQTLISAKNIVYERGKQKIIKGVSFLINEKELMYLCGPNGSGKTTLLRLLAKFILPTRGHIKYSENKKIGYVGHLSGIKNSLTVLENCKLACASNEIQFNSEYTAHLFDDMGFDLKQMQITLTETLSFGQRKRVAMICLCLRNADIWLLDEPFTGLDACAISYLQTFLDKQLEKGGSIVMASHTQPSIFHNKIELD